MNIYARMITPTKYSVTPDDLLQANNNLPVIDSKTVINEPTGNFFYDPWKCKPKFINTVWENIICSLNDIEIGEARIIKLSPGQSYLSHADIDDRYHLTIASEMSYLINLSDEVMHKLMPDGKWYHMDAGYIHTACNFGESDRYQLVVRKLLRHCMLNSAVRVKIQLKDSTFYQFRYVFDSIISPWLNRANKRSIIDNFKVETASTVTFDIEPNHIELVQEMLPSQFGLEII